MTTVWTRSQLKEQAKARLKTFYWQAFILCLIAMILGAGTEGINFRGGKDQKASDTTFFMEYSPGVDFSYNEGRVNIKTPLYNSSFPVRQRWSLITLALGLMTGAAFLAMEILLSNVVEVGKSRYFLKKTAGIQETGVEELFSGFSEGYGNLVLVMFRQKLSIFLWSLLLVIPGVIKNYEYYMVPYLLAENPRLSWEEARDLSRDMMEGNKMRVFVLQLSFIGWDFLGALVCGVGRVFVAPYKETVYGELYHTIKNGSDGAVLW